MNQNEKILKFIETITYFFKYFACSKTNFLKESGLTRTQVVLLYILDSHKTITMNQVAKLMDTTNGAATQLIAGLEKLKFLKRIHDENDRRIINLKFTKYGIEKFKNFKKSHLIFISTILSKFDEDDFNALVKLQTKLMDGLKEIQSLENLKYISHN